MNENPKLLLVLLGALVKKAPDEKVFIELADVEKTNNQVLVLKEVNKGIELYFEDPNA